MGHPVGNMHHHVVLHDILNNPHPVLETYEKTSFQLDFHLLEILELNTIHLCDGFDGCDCVYNVYAFYGYAFYSYDFGDDLYNVYKYGLTSGIKMV